VEFQPSQKQMQAMPLVVLTVCMAFAGIFAFVMGGLRGTLLSLLFAALGIAGAYAARRNMQVVRVGADTQGIWFLDGTRGGHANQHAPWEQVAACVIEHRHADGGVGTPHIVLKDDKNRDVFVLYAKLLSAADTAAFLRYIRAKLHNTKAGFQVPDEWL
jgi:hypothetical protein